VDDPFPKGEPRCKRKPKVELGGKNAKECKGISLAVLNGQDIPKSGCTDCSNGDAPSEDGKDAIFHRPRGQQIIRRHFPNILTQPYHHIMLPVRLHPLALHVVLSPDETSTTTKLMPSGTFSCRSQSIVRSRPRNAEWRLWAFEKFAT